MDRNLLNSVYKIDGLYADPYDVVKLLKTASKNQKQEIVDEIRSGNLDANPNVLKEIKKFEHNRDMSS